MAPQVSGRIIQVHVTDHQTVKAGDLLAEIDDRDLRVALESANAHVMSSQAAIDSLQAHLALQQTAIRESTAAVDADDAPVELALSDVTRYRNLAADGSGTVQALQRAEAHLEFN